MSEHTSPRTLCRARFLIHVNRNSRWTCSPSLCLILPGLLVCVVSCDACGTQCLDTVSSSAHGCFPEGWGAGHRPPKRLVSFYTGQPLCVGLKGQRLECWKAFIGWGVGQGRGSPGRIRRAYLGQAGVLQRGGHTLVTCRYLNSSLVFGGGA